MKRAALLLAITLLLFAQAAAAWAAVPVYLDGKLLEEVAAADIKEGALFAPIRPIAEAVGAQVDYDGRQVRISHEGEVITLTLGSREVSVQGADGVAGKYQLSSPPYLKNGRVLLPLRFVAEQLGCNVVYQGVRVKIILPGDYIGGERAYTMALGRPDSVTGRKRIVNGCIALLAECRGLEIAEPENIVPRASGEYIFYNRQGELIADWRFWVPEGAEGWPYGSLYLENVLTDQFYEADESVYDYYYADDGGQLELEIATYMGAKGSEGD